MMATSNGGQWQNSMLSNFSKKQRYIIKSAKVSSREREIDGVKSMIYHGIFYALVSLHFRLHVPLAILLFLCPPFSVTR